MFKKLIFLTSAVTLLSSTSHAFFNFGGDLSKERAQEVAIENSKQIKNNFKFAQVKHKFENTLQVTPEEIKGIEQILNRQCEEKMINYLQQNPNTKLDFTIDTTASAYNGDRSLVNKNNCSSYKTYPIFQLQFNVKVSSCSTECPVREIEFNGKKNRIISECISTPTATLSGDIIQRATKSEEQVAVASTCYKEEPGQTRGERRKLYGGQWLGKPCELYVGPGSIVEVISDYFRNTEGKTVANVRVIRNTNTEPDRAAGPGCSGPAFVYDFM